MMKKIIIISLLLLGNLSANECVSFEGVDKNSVVEPIIKELSSLGVTSAINKSYACKYKVFLPIGIYIVNDSGQRTTKIYLTLQTDDQPLETLLLQTTDYSSEFYNLARDGKKVKRLLIEKHSKIIAKNIKNQLF